MKPRSPNSKHDARSSAPLPALLLIVAVALLQVITGYSLAQEGSGKATDTPAKKAGEARVRELGKVKQAEALRNLQRLEAIMQKLTARPDDRDPANSVRLREAFSLSREIQIRETMQQILAFIESGKLDRAVQLQKKVESDLQAILDLLLEKELDPRKLLKEIRRVRKILEELDQVIEEETSEKIDSEEAEQAGADAAALKKTIARLEELVRKEKGIELDSSAAANQEARKDLGNRQAGIRKQTGELLEEDLKRARKEIERALEDDHDDHDHPPGEPHEDEEKHERQPAEAGKILDQGKMKQAIEAMKSAEAALAGKGQDGKAQASARAAEARKALEEAIGSSRQELEESRNNRDFPSLKKEQDGTKQKTQDLLEKLSKRVPGVFSPEGGIPGKGDVAKASEKMSSASESLSGAKAGKAAGQQEEAVEELEKGREKVEDTLEALQEAFRNQLIAYLKEKFTYMLAQQKSATSSTRSLDLKLRALNLAAGGEQPEIDIKDRQLAKRLAASELKLSAVCDDVLDVLSEDGTTLVFPEIVVELKADLEQTSELLDNLQTGDSTRMIQKDIEDTVSEILAALEDAAKKPPPPSPNKGREKKNQNSSAPLLAKSAELKMVRALQLRVNRRTSRFDTARKSVDLSSEARSQLREIGRKQKEVEKLLRKIARSVGQ
ncbi:MAG: hypothetical protein VYC32_10195 [Planctomycetota bacterium]|nr:hypothetical protein [Planctomycetota bacterium]